jgi:hypothetical protein
MRIVSGRPPRSRYLERGAAELSREAQKRLQWFDYYQAHGRNAALTSRYFGISRLSASISRSGLLIAHLHTAATD